MKKFDPETTKGKTDNFIENQHLKFSAWQKVFIGVK